MTLQAYLSFLVAALVVIATPGPDSMNSLAIGLARGRREGVAYALGVGVGCLLHTLWAALGVSALVAASATAFAVIKWIGVAYLVVLGVQALRGNAPLALPAAGAMPRPVAASQRFRQGLLTNALNPKVMLFFLAFLPQFVDPSGGAASIPLQMVLMGGSFALVTALAYCALASGAGSIGARLLTRPGVAHALERGTGLVFLTLAARLALAERDRP